MNPEREAYEHEGETLIEDKGGVPAPIGLPEGGQMAAVAAESPRRCRLPARRRGSQSR